MNFIKDFGKEIYNGFYEGIPSDDIGEIITVNFDFPPLNIENIQPQKMVSEWLQLNTIASYQYFTDFDFMKFS